MNELRLKRIVLSTVLFLIAGLVTVSTMTATAGPAAAAPPDPGSYQALAPNRILDTRTGNGAPAAPVASLATLDVTVLGAGGIPASGVSAVVFNLTDVTPSNPGFISAFPAGLPIPLASSLNFAAGETRAHLVVVAPGTSGQVALYNGSSGPVDLLADVVGYYNAGTPTAGGEFAPVNPARILDTRTGNGAPQAPIDRGVQLTVPVAGRGGVPSSGVSSVIINLTATRPSTYGYLTAAPNADLDGSSVNFRTGHNVSNLVITPLNGDGAITVFASLPGHVDVVADVVGYFVGGLPAAAGRLAGLATTRLLDTRRTHAPIPAQGTIDVSVAGHGGVPSGSTAAALNVTVATATTSGYLAAYPTGMTRPTSSTVNFDNNTVANLVIAPLGPDGNVRIYNSSSVPVQVVVDVSGYVGKIPGPLTWSARAPIPGGQDVQRLSCGSPTFCMAFGYLQTDNSYRYDGHSWSSIAFPGPSADEVSCVASRFCMAIGPGGPYVFDGTAWSASSVPARNPGLWSVSCATATFCVVVGTGEQTAIGQVAAAWVYDGSRWTESDPGLNADQGTFVSCASSTSCLMVDATGYTARFDGRHWTSAGRWPQNHGVSALSCVTNAFCLAASSGTVATNNGAGWGPTTTLDVRSVNGDGVGTITCTSTTFCLAATSFGYQLMWNGTSWSNALRLDPAAIDLQNASCVAPSFCMIVDVTGFLTGA